MNEEFIYTPDTNKYEIEKQQNNYFFCSKENADFIDDKGNGQTKIENKSTLAKIIKKDIHTIYQIKILNNNQLYNPLSKFDRERSYSFLDNVVRPADKFISVNGLVFQYYLKFLSTGNIAWLNKAERERL